MKVEEIAEAVAKAAAGSTRARFRSSAAFNFASIHCKQ
jgi:hypothetical protein